MGLFFAVPKRQLVQTFQQGFVLRNSKVEKLLSPTPFQVPAQEMLTVDGLAVRVSLGGEYRVVDPALFVTVNRDAFGALYVELRQVLRIAAGELSSKSFFSEQGLLMTRTKELLVPKSAQLGIELTQLEILEAVPVG